MTSRGRLVTILIALTIFGCKGPVQTSAASAGEGASGVAPGEGASGPSSTVGGTRVEYITDPSLNNMNAFATTILAKWNFHGVLYEGGNCVPNPYGVFRASSPDGRSFVERMPPLGWIWATGPTAAYLKTLWCLPMKGPMTAQDFLKHLAQTLQVEYVADESVPAEQKAQANADTAQANQNQAQRRTTELAQAIVRYKNGTSAMKGELSVRLDCTELALRGIPSNQPLTTYHQCTASARYMAAPEAEFAKVKRMWDTPGMGGRPEQAWQQAWLQASLRRIKEEGAERFTDLYQRQSAAMQGQQQRFEHNQAVQQHMHEDFMATMQAGTDASMARAQASTNARTTAASDWVDYALDQKTVMNTNTGQTYKISNQAPVYTPQEQQVHGNGTP